MLSGERDSGEQAGSQAELDGLGPPPGSQLVEQPARMCLDGVLADEEALGDLAVGEIRWQHRWVNASHLLAGLEIGFEAIDDGLWDVFFGPVWLGHFHEAVGRIVDQSGRPIRRRGGNHKGRNNANAVLPIT